MVSRVNTGLAFVAGESSGDALTASLLPRLQQEIGLSAYGIGGLQMVNCGFHAEWSSQELAVNGYIEALPRIPKILWIRHQLKKKLLRSPPAAFIGVDAPDFNLSLELALREHGIPIIHLISPAIWAWRFDRIKKIARAVDHMLCIFPFEKKIYDEAGIAATYIGHPFAQQIAMEPDVYAARQQLGLARSNHLTLAILPGSRLSEIHALGPVFAKTAQLLSKNIPKIQCLLPIATPELEQPIRRYFVNCPIRFYSGQARLALTAADIVLLASGTATLEAALCKKPMVIAYKVSALTAMMMKRKARITCVGLPNILMQKSLVPEFLQERARPELLAAAILALWDDQEQRLQLQQDFHQLHTLLKKETTTLAVAEIINVLKQHQRL